jgi:hypothetical protein
MAKASTARHLAWVLIAVTVGLCQGRAEAASDVADAVMRQNQAQLRALIAAAADVNAPQLDGTTALHWAAYHGDTHAAAALLAAKANPSLRTDTGVTPLSLACEVGNAEIVRLLLEGGADVNQTLDHGETPLMMAARTELPRRLASCRGTRPGCAVRALNRYHVQMLAYLVKKLSTIAEGEGTLLDRSLILYGSNMGNSNQHLHYDVPHVLVGGASGRLKGDRHLAFASRTVPTGNLLLSILDKFEVPADSFGDSTGRLEGV